MSRGNLSENESKSEVIVWLTDSVKYSAAMTVAERVRMRLKDEMQERHISQRELSDILARNTGEVWTQSRVQKVLTGYVELKVEDVDAMARALGISLCEAVRDPGMEFYAEMTPTEVRMFQRLQRKPDALDAILILLGLPRPASERKARPDERPPKPKRGRPLRSATAQALPPDKSGSRPPRTAHDRPRPK